MKLKTVRAGFVGAGFAGNLYIEGLHRVYDTDAEFVGVYSRNRDKAAAFANTHGGAIFDALDDMLEKINVLHVVAPYSLRESLAITLSIPSGRSRSTKATAPWCTS